MLVKQMAQCQGEQGQMGIDIKIALNFIMLSKNMDEMHLTILW